MDLRKLTERAKRVIDKRGGTGALKQDAEELRDIARSKGSASDKAKRAADAIKHPGAAQEAAPDAPAPPRPPDA